MYAKSEYPLIRLIVILFGFAATAMVLLPALIYKETSTSFTGLQVALGYEFASLGSLASGEIQFSILTLLAFLLPAIGAIYLIIDRKGFAVSALFFLISTFLLFLIPFFTVVTVTIIGDVTPIDAEWTYGIGLIAAALFAIFAMMSCIYKLSLKK